MAPKRMTKGDLLTGGLRIQRAQRPVERYPELIAAAAAVGITLTPEQARAIPRTKRREIMRRAAKACDLAGKRIAALEAKGKSPVPEFDRAPKPR